jgi:hypothetical protein
MKRNIGFGGFPSNIPSNIPPNIPPKPIAPIQPLPAQYCPPQPCPQYCPPQVFPAQYDPPLVSPGQQFVKTNLFNKVVTHVHPSHTTTVNKHMIHHQHYFPHTESCVNECCETHTMCGVPVNPCCPSGPFGF